MEFKRLFTREEAARSLPLVRQIVSDILDTASRIRERQEGGEDTTDLRDSLSELTGELEAMGCYFKDWNFSIGLVDFPAIVDGRQVFLCWRSDEDDLSWYHPIGEGYRGRRPL